MTAIFRIGFREHDIGPAGFRVRCVAVCIHREHTSLSIVGDAGDGYYVNTN